MSARFVRFLIIVGVLAALAGFGLLFYAMLFGAQCSGVVINGNHVTPFTCPSVLGS